MPHGPQSPCRAPAPRNEDLLGDWAIRPFGPKQEKFRGLTLSSCCPSAAVGHERQYPDFTSAFRGIADMAGPFAGLVPVENDPSATLAVHCGNGFDARFEPYQSTRLSRYNAGP